MGGGLRDYKVGEQVIALSPEHINLEMNRAYYGAYSLDAKVVSVSNRPKTGYSVTVTSDSTPYLWEVRNPNFIRYMTSDLKRKRCSLCRQNLSDDDLRMMRYHEIQKLKGDPDCEKCHGDFWVNEDHEWLRRKDMQLAQVR